VIKYEENGEEKAEEEPEIDSLLDKFNQMLTILLE
jgi:hypothetical protein